MKTNPTTAGKRLGALLRSVSFFGSPLFSVEPRTIGHRASRPPSPLRKGSGNEGEGKGVMNLMAHEHSFDAAQQGLVMGWPVYGCAPHPGPTAIELATEGAPAQPRRGVIFVVINPKKQSSVGATSSRSCRPYGAWAVGRAVSTKMALLRSSLKLSPANQASFLRATCLRATHRQAEEAAMKPATPPTLRPANGGTTEDGKTEAPPSTQLRKVVFGDAHVPLSRPLSFHL